MSKNQFHYGDCQIMTLLDRVGVCNCREVWRNEFDQKHTALRMRFPRLFRWIKGMEERITFLEVKL